MEKKPSLAIAFSVQKRGKKMAKGGMVKGAEATQEPAVPMAKPDNSRPAKDDYMGDNAHTGAPISGYPIDEESIVDAILSKRRADIMMAQGGEVPGQGDIDGESGQAPYDELNSMAYKKELYDDSQLSRQPMDGDQHGDTDGDYTDEGPAKSLVERIRARMKTRRGF